MLVLVLIDTSVSILIFFGIYILLKNKQFSTTVIKSFSIIFGSIILSSLLLNLNYLLYSLSLYTIGILISSYFMSKSIEFINNVRYFWIVYSVTAFILYSMILTKKMFYNNISYNPGQGNQGFKGKKGPEGNSYYLHTNSDKCYHILENTIERLIKENKEENEIIYDESEVQFKNIYLKNKIKRICLSQNFEDKIKESDFESLQESLVNEISNWVLLILDIESIKLEKNYGLEFLTDYFYNEENYFKQKNIENPFTQIKKSVYWSWN